MIKFFDTYLKNRKMQVKHEGAISKPVSHNKLRTPFAIMVINSITDKLNYPESQIFTGEFKMSKKISCEQDCIDLQNNPNTYCLYRLVQKYLSNVKKSHLYYS